MSILAVAPAFPRIVPAVESFALFITFKDGSKKTIALPDGADPDFNDRIAKQLERCPEVQSVKVRSF